MSYGERDKHVLWHPFTPMSEWVAGDPLVIERGEGNYLIDTEGRRYLDGISSLWTTLHGHNHPAINAAIRDQLDRVAHSTLLGLTHPAAIELAEQLVAVAPKGLTRVFYSDSGSTAVEIALKQAFQYWSQRGELRRTRFVHLENAYHGDTLGTVGVGGIELFHRIFGPLIVAGIPVPSPVGYPDLEQLGPAVLRDRALARLDKVLTINRGQVAAVVLEPLVQGAAGMLVQPPGYLAGVAELCRLHNVLLIVDEVATGFGRTGTLFACEQEQVTPDFLCLAKGLSGGYLPLAATLSTERVYEAFLGERSLFRTFFHGHTYTGNPLACAAACASLRLFDGGDVLRHVRAMADHAGRLLREQLAPLPWVGDIRQRGLMIGIELVRHRDRHIPFQLSEFRGVRVCSAARKNGVILRPLGDVIVWMPPLSITPEDLELLATATRLAIEETCADAASS
jgi:adenosylmethionine-8-amino-7-oxononanoate aminotransferase